MMSSQAVAAVKWNNPGTNNGCKENPVEVINDNGVIAKKLAARRTINVFRAWDTPQSGPSAVTSQSYGLYWTVRPMAPKSTITLSQLNWAFNYPRYSYDDYPGIENFIMEEDWIHEEEYGKTLTLKFWDQNFPEYIGNVAAAEAKYQDGIMLDWWRDQGGVLKSTGLDEAKMKVVRTNIAKAIREALGPEKIILGNVGWDRNPVTLEYINGVFLELYKKPGKQRYNSKDLRKIEQLLQFYEKCLRWPKMIAMAPWRVSEKGDYQSIPATSPENIRYAKLFTAMAMVVPSNGYILYSDNNWDREDSDYGHSYYEFYNTDFGQPTTPLEELNDGAAYKVFEKGLIAYNINSKEITFQTPHGLTIEIPPKSGIFCGKVDTKFICSSSETKTMPTRNEKNHD